MTITTLFSPPRRKLALSALLLCLPLLAQSQAFPSKPIRLIVPFQAGGGNDLLARIISQKFLEKWGQPVIVDNKPGAGGNLGADFVSKAPPDGYTLLLGTNTLAINPSVFAKMPFDTQRDFAPVAIGGQVDVMWATVNVALPMVSSGKVRGLALAEPQRTAALKDVPVVAETLPGYEVNAWYGIFAPTGTPAPVVQQLSQELQQIFRQPDIQARLLPLGYEIATDNAERTREILARDLEKWRKVVKSAGIRPE